MVLGRGEVTKVNNVLCSHSTSPDIYVIMMESENKSVKWEWLKRNVPGKKDLEKDQDLQKGKGEKFKEQKAVYEVAYGYVGLLEANWFAKVRKYQ